VYQRIAAEYLRFGGNQRKPALIQREVAVIQRF